MRESPLRYPIALPVLLILAGCGGSSSSQQSGGAAARNVPLTPSVLYCQRSGGEVIANISGGRRADLCRLPNGRTVRAADLLNSHNSL